MQIGATPLKRRGHVLIGNVHRFGFLPQLGERLLLKVLSAVLLDERFTIFLRRSKPSLFQFIPILVIGAELPSHLLDLAIRPSRDVGVGHLELQLFRFLNEDFLIDELAEHRSGESSLPR